MTDTKTMVFRIPEALKKDFRIVLMKNGISIQDTFQAFTETLVAHDKGEKIADALKTIIKRSQTLGAGV